MTRQLVICFALLSLQCSGGGDEGPPDATPIAFDRAGLISNIGQNVVVPTYEQFRTHAGELSTAVSSYCAALGTGSEATALDAARAAWRTAIGSWQLAEVMQIGPAAASALRDGIYSWPVISACSVDLDVELLRMDPNNYDITSRLTNRRGLDAVEYMLFASSLDTACAPQVAPAGWNDLPDSTRAAARCAYLEIAATDLAAQAQGLVDAWSGGADDYLSQLESAAEIDSLNAIFAALFYLDLRTKDGKLGITTAAAVESPFANHSKENAVANLTGFRMLFFGESLAGVDGLGFDDFLRAADAATISDGIAADVTAADTAVASIPGTLAEALAADVNAAVAAHGALKVITDKLKAEVPATLGLKVPVEAGGDAD